jgi:hypothetical protein
VTSVNPASGAAITVTPADNNSAGNGTTSFTRTYNSGSAVTLTAPATAGGNMFLSWSGCSTSSTVTCNVTMNASYTVTATYTTPVVYMLTVNSVYPSSGVAINVTPADNNSKASGTTGFALSYNQGAVVTLTAPATAGGNSFSSWSGCTSATTVTCNVTMGANAFVVASYSVPASSITTYYVSGTGSDSDDGLTTATAFRTLQHAADLTLPGDTVYAMNGTYTNTICATCNVLNIYNPGTATNWITYKAYAGQTPVISFNGWAGVSIGFSAAYVEVNGFTIIGNNANVTLAGAQAQSTTNPDPIYNGNCISIDGRQGSTTIRPNHINILNNIISECGGGGVGTAWADYVTISGNTIYNTAWYSIYGASGISTWENWNSDSSTGYKMFITGNRLYGNKQLVPTSAGGGITDGEAIIIDSTRNSVYNSTNDPLPAYTGRTYIANNVIYANGSSAIEAFQSDHVDVVNNSTYQNVTNPPLSGRGELDLNQTTDDNAFNNIFYNATGQNPVAIEPGTTSSIVLDYNLYYNGTNTGDVANGAHDLTANPLFVDPADANPLDVLLTVSSSSPAVGTGTSNLAPATDFADNPRPGSKGYDRGAYQQP